MENGNGTTAAADRRRPSAPAASGESRRPFGRSTGSSSTAVGYEGEHVDNPTYEQVCGETTGHVEVCQVEFDPERVSFETLVEKYFDIHDPTQLNRQGFDVGYRYRSAIFAHSDEQAEVAREVIERVQPRYSAPIVTAIEPAQPFWRFSAEEYHQCYLDKRRSGSGLLGQLLGQ